MMGTAALDRAGATDTRQRLIDAAVELFTRHSFAGTSLQMIADELGFTKAAIYHHFRTREQLLAAVLEPMLDELRAIIESAEARRTAHARAEHMLSGYAALAVRNRGLVAVLAADPGVGTVLHERPEWGRPDKAPASPARRCRSRAVRSDQGGDGVRRDGRGGRADMGQP
jgi:AcrR family transcriptional regulator